MAGAVPDRGPARRASLTVYRRPQGSLAHARLAPSDRGRRSHPSGQDRSACRTAGTRAGADAHRYHWCQAITVCVPWCSSTGQLSDRRVVRLGRCLNTRRCRDRHLWLRSRTTRRLRRWTLSSTMARPTATSSCRGALSLDWSRRRLPAGSSTRRSNHASRSSGSCRPPCRRSRLRQGECKHAVKLS